MGPRLNRPRYDTKVERVGGCLCIALLVCAVFIICPTIAAKAESADKQEGVTMPTVCQTRTG